MTKPKLFIFCLSKLLSPPLFNYMSVIFDTIHPLSSLSNTCTHTRTHTLTHACIRAHTHTRATCQIVLKCLLVQILSTRVILCWLASRSRVSVPIPQNKSIKILFQLNLIKLLFKLNFSSIVSINCKPVVINF